MKLLIPTSFVTFFQVTLLILPSSYGFPPFPFMLPRGPELEIKLHSSFNISEPQFTLFDYDGIDDGIEGKLVTSDPLDACSPIKEPADSSDYENPTTDFDFGKGPTFWILLANNLNCDLATKVANALAAQYFAILIADLDPDFASNPDLLSSPYSIIHVRSRTDELDESPIFFEDKTEYCFRFSGTLLSDILSYSLILFLGLGLVMILITILVWLFQVMGGDRLLKYLHSRRRAQNASIALESRTSVQRWMPDAPFINNEICTICLDDFTPVDRVRVLRCCHGFHVDCVDPWILKVSESCPICKQGVDDNPVDGKVQTFSPEAHYDEEEPLLPVPTRLDL